MGGRHCRGVGHRGAPPQQVAHAGQGACCQAHARIQVPVGWQLPHCIPSASVFLGTLIRHSNRLESHEVRHAAVHALCCVEHV